MILKPGSEKADFKFIQAFDDWFNSIRDKYLAGASIFINSAKITLITFLGIVLFVLFMFKIIPTGFLPTEDKGAIFTQIQLPDGSSASRTDDVAREIEDRLMSIPGVENTITLVGYSGENTALIVSELDKWSNRKKKELQMQSILKKVQSDFSTYPSATIASFSPPSISGLGMFGGFEYQLLDKGNRTAQELYDEAVKLMTAANKNPDFSMVYTSYSANLPQLLLDIDISKAMAQGVDISEIYGALSGYFGKSYINDFNKYGRVYRVYMQAESDFRARPGDIDKIYVKNRAGTMVPLSAVIKIKNMLLTLKMTHIIQIMTGTGKRNVWMSCGATG